MASETSKHIIVDFANSNTRNNNTVQGFGGIKIVKNLIKSLANCQNAKMATRPKWNFQIFSMQRKFSSMRK